MNIPWGLIVFVVGIAYGYMTPGRQNKTALFKKGLLWGVIIAVVVAILGFVFNLNPLGLGDVGIVSILLSAVVLTLLFILGVWIGDWIEGRRDTRALRRT